MSLTVATLQQHIHERRQRELKPERVELGQGFAIEVEKGILFIFCDASPDDRAICGFVDAQHDDRWVLRREWHVELLATFGQLPANVIVDGEE